MRVEAVAVLRAGRSAVFRPYDWTRNVLHERTVTVAAAPVVIVEGLFVSRPELEDLDNMSVVVTADDDVRRRRQLERADAPQAWLDRWEEAEQLFFEHTRPPYSFDILVNSDP
jgi:uridine kinase